MKTTKKTKSFETEVETCCHHVSVRYWGFNHKLTPELQTELIDEAQRRATDCIIEGFSSGELNCLYHTKQDGSDDEEIRGWWEIKTD